MRPIHLVLLALVAALAGCTNVPKPVKQQINATSKDYQSVTRGMARAEVEARFGAPLREESDGSHYWETRFDERNFTSLKVWYDDSGRVQRAQATRGRGLNAPLLHTSTSITREK